MIYTLTFLATLSGALYWAYKKFRGPVYKPGMLAQLAKASFPKATSIQGDDGKSYWRIPTEMQQESGGTKSIDVDLFYFSPPIKSSERPVVGLHGGPAIGPTETWKLCHEIPNMHLYHSRGCGFSNRLLQNFPSKGMWPGMQILERTLGIAAQISDLESIRQRVLEDAEPTTTTPKLDLVGHSFGGFIATLYAAEFPEHVRSLTLLVPASVLVLPTKDKTMDFMGLVEAKIAEKGTAEQAAEYKDFLKNEYFNFSNLPQQTETSLAQRQADFAKYYSITEEECTKVDSSMIGGMACYAAFMSMGMEHDYVSPCKKLLAGATFPVAIVHGGDDLLPPSNSEQYRQLFPPACNVTFEVVPDTSHFLMDSPRVIEIVRDNIRRAD